MRRLIPVLVLGCAAVAPRLAAQDPGLIPVDQAEIVDRIVAIVGNEAILWSQVQELVFQRRAEGVPMPEDDAGMRVLLTDAIGELVNTELLVQQARRDTSIVVTDEEVAKAVQDVMNDIRKQFTSELDYVRELQRAGFQTPEEFRQYRYEQQRRALLQSRLIETLEAAGKLEPVQPTEQEMQQYFDERKTLVGSRPATIAFRQIVVNPKASAAAQQAALQKADSLVRALRGGADFATAAKRFSMDPGSGENGGDLGWFRRGAMQPAFEETAFTLRPGVISDPVETAFGYHIIQVQRTQPAEVQARHILIRPDITPTDAAAAEALADSIFVALEAGASFDSLQRLHPSEGDFEETPEIALDQLTAPYDDKLTQADSGQVVAPFRMASPDGNANYDKWAIVEVTSRRSEGAVTFADVRDQIRQVMARELAIKRYIEQLRSGTYVDIRDL